MTYRISRFQDGGSS